ncbi:MAG: hypothetical protein HND44_21245 [Chloroflexi bacterium]|nr:hypothetical protein [Ardenticatenaceae bacterium]MBL1130968.1 hypothetical protein [Chloroflexota bacterium]NOG37067.1 hypothetical protein [Chloroflexota bacterium]GIK57045.1 MAG: hypothetical protein BroJett015_27080 [Chloroflexota bacterium]
MTALLLFKLLVVVLFLVMFLRRPSLSWGVGLLTVTTALLLDTILGTFNREAFLAELGFFFYFIAGAIGGGGVFWFLGVLWPHLPQSASAQMAAAPVTAVGTPAVGVQERTPMAPSANGQPETIRPEPLPVVDAAEDPEAAAYDVPALLADIQQRFGREDVLDLMFDLEIPETAVVSLNQNLHTLAYEVVAYATRNGQTAQLALAIERILTPPPPEMLPRLEKLTPVSPRASLRYVLLARYNLEKLQQMAARLGIDWEQLEGVEKRGKVRELLQYLYRRNRVDELLALMREGVGETAVSPVETNA